MPPACRQSAQWVSILLTGRFLATQKTKYDLLHQPRRNGFSEKAIHRETMENFAAGPTLPAALWLAMGAFPAWAQTGASLSGVVTDQTGAAVPGVSVTIRNADTGATRTSATDGGGRYQESGLPPGRFDIRAAKREFADETRTGVSLAAGQEAVVDIKMHDSPTPARRWGLPPDCADLVRHLHRAVRMTSASAGSATAYRKTR